MSLNCNFFCSESDIKFWEKNRKSQSIKSNHRKERDEAKEGNREKNQKGKEEVAVIFFFK